MLLGTTPEGAGSKGGQCHSTNLSLPHPPRLMPSSKELIQFKKIHVSSGLGPGFQNTNHLSGLESSPSPITNQEYSIFQGSGPEPGVVRMVPSRFTITSHCSLCQTVLIQCHPLRLLKLSPVGKDPAPPSNAHALGACPC